jgi:hypothetical protein
MTAAADPRALMVLAVGNRRVAVRGGEVSEIARVAMVTPVPCDDPAILGVTLHRGRIVPLVDLRRRLGDGATGLPPFLCLFTQSGGADIGVPIDAMLGFGAADGSRVPDGVTLVDLSTLAAGDGAATAR